MGKQGIEMGLKAHVKHLIEMRVVDMRKNAEHLLVDGLAR